jgi:hypothetical protein
MVTAVARSPGPTIQRLLQGGAMKRSLKSAVSLHAASVLLTLLPVSQMRADVIVDWNNVFLDTIRATGGPPCPIARAAAMVHVAMYDAVNSIARTHEPYMAMFTVDSGASKEAAAVTAAHGVLSALYGGDNDLQFLFDSQLATHLGAIPDGPAKADGIALGAECVTLMLESRADDGSDNSDPYVPGGNPGDWAPTLPDFSGPASPNWPLVTPWTMRSGSQFRPTGPAGFTDMAALLASPEYALQFDDVYAYGDIDSAVRTEYETETARFWANDRDGTYKPPGHLYHITQVVSADHGLTLEENARLFALVGLAMADAGIVAWDAKYATPIDLWRPVTGIHQADTDGNRGTAADATWVPLSHDPDVNGFTPPFPAYVSGHATFGAAHAAIMTRFFGSNDVSFTITSDDTPDVLRTYRKFSDAALENGRSRVFLGVHWQWDADDGYVAGTALGNHIADHFLRLLGDLNGDGVINGADLGVLLLAWGDCPRGAACPADLTGNGVIDGEDLGVLLLNWTG